LSGNDLRVGLVLGLYVLPELSDNFKDNYYQWP